MTRDDVDTLMGFLKGAFPNLTEAQVETYSSMLIFEDAALASKAILQGVNEWRFPPAWAEIKERIRALTPRHAPRPVEEALAEATVPDWVRRWTFARFLAEPRDMRPFREQHVDVVRRGEEPEGGWMPSDAYVEEAKTVTDQMVRKVMSSGGRTIVRPDNEQTYGGRTA